MGGTWSGSRAANRAESVVVDGIRFHSRAEARYWLELRRLKASGEILLLERQRCFELVPAYQDAAGLHHRAVRIRVDFYVVWADGRREIVDVKGPIKESWQIKWRLLCWQLRDSGIGLRIQDSDSVPKHDLPCRTEPKPVDGPKKLPSRMTAEEYRRRFGGQT